ncbi:MAG: acetylhydrolase [Planctomycetota bacterium]|nr:MAG: acetylhydrolase [Planctomycetota bacterium]
MNKLMLLLFCLTIQRTLDAKGLESHYFEVAYGKRALSIKVYMEQGISEKKPLIIYSHGLGGSNETKKYLLEYWAEAGFICVSVQHPGSDEMVWKNVVGSKKLKAMKDAASTKQFLIRNKDIPAVLNQLEKWNISKTHKLFDRIDFTKVAMSGHSFGAVTAQAMMGAEYHRSINFKEKRIMAFLLMSPSPVSGKNQSKALDQITSPVLCMTGTKDTSMIKPSVGYKERASLYHALPKGYKYLYIFDGGKHNLFSGPNIFNKKLKEEHIVIQKLSLLFWQAHLLNNAKAQKELDNFKARENDNWKKK